MSGGAQIVVRVAGIETVARDIKCFELRAASGSALPAFSAGAHVIVTMQGDRVYRNPYSLMGSLRDNDSYRISVLRTEPSRGGSRFLHDAVKVGDLLSISHPINLFSINQMGHRHVLVAGGIGITPIMAMAEQLAATDKPFELHYGVRSRECGAYLDRLVAAHGPHVRIYRDDLGEGLPLARIVHQPVGSHLYCCGPNGMIDAVSAAARAAGWPAGHVHTERFLAPAGGAPFAVKLKSSGLTVTVGEQESILDALEAAGVEPPYLCRGGACGQCETAVVSSDGEILHNDHYLDPDDRRSGRKIMICVSRLKGGELVLDI